MTSAFDPKQTSLRSHTHAPARNGLAKKVGVNSPADAARLLIVFTGWVNEQVRLRARTVGFDHFVVKPDLNALLNLISAAQGKQRPSAFLVRQRLSPEFHRELTSNPLAWPPSDR